jgi:SAM-dependent methyltransferase
MHNLRGITDLAVKRSQNLIFPTVIIDKVVKNLENASVLTIGPRAEGEIYNLIGHGFSAKNIQGLDLISYSPYVKLGDMHSMSFAENSFDVIFSGWVMAYSNDRQKAASEMLRVAQNGAVIAIGCSYNPLTEEELLKQNGYLTGTDNRILSIEHILSLFGDNIDKIYFKQDVEDKTQFCDLIAIFSIKKGIK